MNGKNAWQNHLTLKAIGYTCNIWIKVLTDLSLRPIQSISHNACVCLSMCVSVCVVGCPLCVTFKQSGDFRLNGAFLKLLNYKLTNYKVFVSGNSFSFHHYLSPNLLQLHHQTSWDFQCRWSCIEWWSGDRWQVTGDRWHHRHVTYYRWHMTCHRWHILYLFYLWPLLEHV